MLRIPTNRLDLEEWCKEVIDECMQSSQERQMIYTRAAQYFYAGTAGVEAAIYNKTKPFVEKLSGFLMQPTDVSFNVIYDTSESESVLERALLVSEKLTADYRNNESDITFSEALTWSMINGCYFLKHTPEGETFRIKPVHPANFGVLGESILSLDEQEVFVHITFPTMSRVRDMLKDHPKKEDILSRIADSRPSEKD